MNPYELFVRKKTLYKASIKKFIKFKDKNFLFNGRNIREKQLTISRL